MNICLINPEKYMDEKRNICLPVTEDKLVEIAEQLGIPSFTAEKNCLVISSDCKCIENTMVNLDELQYFAKRMDGLDKRQLRTFYAAAKTQGNTQLKELINLVCQIDNYFLITDFSDKKRLARDYMLTKEGGMSAEELENVQENAADAMLADVKNQTVTEFGVLYKINTEQEQVYDGKHFPPYDYDNAMLEIELKGTNGQGESVSEYLYFPCENSSIDKAVFRLSEDDAAQMECLLSYEADETMHNIISQYLSVENLHKINDIANKLYSHQTQDNNLELFVKMIDICCTSSIDMALELANDLDQFEELPETYSVEDYAYYLVFEEQKFGFVYDELADFINLEEFGESYLEHSVYCFTEDGMFIYWGSNPTIKEVFKNGMEEPKHVGLEIHM